MRDESTWKILNARREWIVRLTYGSLLQAEDIGRFGFVGMAAAGLGASAERCPKDPEPAQPQAPEAKSESLQIDDAPRIPCPFEKHPLSIKRHAEADFRIAQVKLIAAMSSDFPVGKPAAKRTAP